MKTFTNIERIEGERAVRNCSEKAQEFYNCGCGITVYAVRVPAEDVQLLKEEEGSEFVTRYFTRGDYMDNNNLTLFELDEILAGMNDD